MILIYIAMSKPRGSEELLSLLKEQNCWISGRLNQDRTLISILLQRRGSSLTLDIKEKKMYHHILGNLNPQTCLDAIHQSMDSNPTEKSSNIAAAIGVSHRTAAQYLHGIGYLGKGAWWKRLLSSVNIKKRKEWAYRTSHVGEAHERIILCLILCQWMSEENPVRSFQWTKCNQLSNMMGFR